MIGLVRWLILWTGSNHQGPVRISAKNQCYSVVLSASSEEFHGNPTRKTGHCEKSETKLSRQPSAVFLIHQLSFLVNHQLQPLVALLDGSGCAGLWAIVDTQWGMRSTMCDAADALAPWPTRLPRVPWGFWFGELSFHHVAPPETFIFGFCVPDSCRRNAQLDAASAVTKTHMAQCRWTRSCICLYYACICRNLLLCTISVFFYIYV